MDSNSGATANIQGEVAQSFSPIMSRRFSLRRNLRSDTCGGNFDNSPTSSNNNNGHNYQPPYSSTPSPLEQGISGSLQSLSNSSMSADHGSDCDGEPCTNEHSTRHLFPSSDDQASIDTCCKIQTLKSRSRMSSSSSTRAGAATNSKFPKNTPLKLSLCQQSSQDSKARSLFDVSKCDNEVPEKLIEKDPFLMVKYVRPSTSAIAISESQKEEREAVLNQTKFDQND
ncbi:uncharacterized protein LOC142342412 [Convolutriloba macropyga]|uniref:uncharacterized protein LOC142342412 n=1 Tax=Convolutriloba macropyga TaxID=536237 RepID=UPI003F51FEAB